MSRLACIYALTDPSDGRIYYVGSTIYFARRMKQHLYRPRNAHPCYVGKPVSQWVMSLLTAGRTPQGVILESDPPDGLDLAEQRWIAQCLTRQEPLLNSLTPRRCRQQTRPWSHSKPAATKRPRTRGQKKDDRP